MPKMGSSSSPTSKKSRTAKSTPTREEIALRAYQIYMERGGTPGHELEDWIRAEHELTEKNGKPRRKNEPKPIAA